MEVKQNIIRVISKKGEDGWDESSAPESEGGADRESQKDLE